MNQFSLHYAAFKRGFTLIELLVVIAIIAVLASVLFPIFPKVRGNAHLSAHSQHKYGMLPFRYYSATILCVTKSEDGLPIAGMKFTREPISTNAPKRYMQVFLPVVTVYVTDKQGHFEIPRRIPGVYRVDVEGGNGYPGGSQIVKIAPHRTTRVVFVLHKSP